MNFGKQFKEGLLTNNPVTVQLLGMCSTMAITTSMFNGLGMGLSVTIILTLSNIFIALLRKINAERGTAMLFISHDLSLVRQLCHRVIVMQQGRIVETGDTESIFQNPQEDYTKALIDAIPKVDLGPIDEADAPADGTEVEA